MWLAALVFAGVAPVSAPAVADDAEPAATVLVVSLTNSGYAPIDRITARMVPVLRERSNRRVDVKTEFLDVLDSRGTDYDLAVLEYIRQKYAGTRVVAVVGVGAQGVSMAVRIRAEIFPSAAMMYVAVDRKIVTATDLGGNATGATATLDVPGTVALALRLLPATERVAVVLGASDNERPWHARSISEIQAAAPGVEVIPLFGLPKEEMIGRISTLPERTVILWLAYRRDPLGMTYMPNEVLAEARRAASAPMFVVFTYDFGDGVVGGRLIDLERQGEEAGVLAARIVNGERADAIPPVDVADNPVAVDWREVLRWRIDPGLVPPEAVVHFREPTAWESYKSYILGGAAVIALQALLIAALVAHRTRLLRAKRAIAERLRFERLFTDLSARFADVPVEGIDSALAEGLEEIRALYGADRVTLVQFDQDPSTRPVLHSATAEGIEASPGDVEMEYIHDLVEHARGESLQFADPDDIRPELTRVRDAIRRQGIKSGVVVPLAAAGTALGSLGIASIREPRAWPADAAARLETLAVIFANALVRKRAAAELHRSEEMSGAVLGSIAAQVCVLSRDGRIRAMNDAWGLSSSGPRTHSECLLVGERCPLEAGAEAPCASARTSQLRNPIRAVLDGSQVAFTSEYRSAAQTSDAWFLLTVEQFRTPEGGAVMTHQNITSRKRAELDAEQRRQELAHVSRVSTMGELAASIAHELNQPLTGVLSNAQAALRFLDHEPPDLGEVREILGEIVEDDRRAGEVIRRLRAMLRMGTVELADVDVDELIDDVVKLLATDSALRGVTIETMLAASPRKVRGDQIQLKQVILNLVVNAMDAMKETGAKDRCVSIWTAAVDPSTVMIVVSDRGQGIEEDKLGRIFQPFFTTKPEGMGMGLSIARTIVEAHGGTLWALNNPDRGASMHCKLPMAIASEAPDGVALRAKAAGDRAAGGGA